jgi:HAD superfamily hydrolase (TIGR01509 family)
MAASSIDIVLFDLGGVLFEVGGVGAMRALAGVDSDDELWRRWLTCPWVRRFERGDCTTEEFAAGVVTEWKLPIDPAAFLGEFADWIGEPMAGATSLVGEVKARVPVGCLSNTNDLHWQGHFTRWPIFDDFSFRFLSFELGLVKPDRALFDEVAQRLPTARERVLFLDDNLLNVEGATAAGFRAAHVRGVDEARRSLIAHKVLDA